jgi:hypothetical protein
MKTGRRRIAIAVEPPILGDALTSLLARRSGDEVVNVSRARPEQPDFDAAVVTVVLPPDIRAGVVIELPDRSSMAWVIAVLDAYCPREFTA